MNHIQIAAHDKRTVDFADDLANFFEGGDGLFVANRVWAPKAVMVHDIKASFEPGNLEIEIIGGRFAEYGMLTIFPIDEFRGSMSKRNPAKDKIAKSATTAR